MTIRLGRRYGPRYVASAGHGACLCHGAVAQRVSRVVAEGVSRRTVLKGAAGVVAAAALGGPDPTRAQTLPTPSAPATLVLANARIFDGLSSQLIDGRDVLIASGRIVDLLPRGQAVADATVLDCTGKVIMPGLIDAHWHSFLAALPQTVAMTADAGYLHLLAAEEAQRTLMRGFTSVRDAGGPVFALKRAIDEGRFAGPRIYPSGAMISQTSGHGDFRARFEGPYTPTSPLSPAEQVGISIITDGVPEMLRRTREQLLQGASQVKVFVGGGVSSRFDPLDSIQFTDAEIRAAVDAARDWGTYVAAHVYTPDGIARALACGVRSIEHGQLADEASAKRMADAGAWWSLQPFLADEDANPQASPEQQAQQKLIAEGTVRAFELCRTYEVKTAIGTDILFSPAKTATQGRQLAKIARFLPNADVLRLATARNGELLALSGARNPYPGRIGVIEKRAHADLLVVEDDPLEEIGLIGDPERMRVIVKAGVIHKNTLTG